MLWPSPEPRLLNRTASRSRCRKGGCCVRRLSEARRPNGPPRGRRAGASTTQGSYDCRTSSHEVGLLTLGVTRGGRTPIAGCQRAPSARRRVHAVVRRQHHLMLPWFRLPAERPGQICSQSSCLAGRAHVVWPPPTPAALEPEATTVKPSWRAVSHEKGTETEG